MVPLRIGEHGGTRTATITYAPVSVKRRPASRSAAMTLNGVGYKYKKHSGMRGAPLGSSFQNPISRFADGPQALLALVVTLGTALCVGLWALFSCLPPHREKVDVAPGLALMETLEQRDPEAVDQILRDRQPQPPTVSDGVELDEGNIWSAFHDYVILGDSRAVGFYYFDFLDPNRVMADGGNTIRQVAEHMDEIVALQPRYVYLCYGLNDVSIGYWDTPEEYAAEFMQTVADVQARVPGVTVVVSSILPAKDPAFDLDASWYNIPSFNQVLAAACQEKGVPYADNDAIAAEHFDLWQPDGIHLRPEFYPSWAKNLIEAGMNHE